MIVALRLFGYVITSDNSWLENQSSMLITGRGNVKAKVVEGQENTTILAQEKGDYYMYAAHHELSRHTQCAPW